MTIDRTIQFLYYNGWVFAAWLYQLSFFFFWDQYRYLLKIIPDINGIFAVSKAQDMVEREKELPEIKMPRSSLSSMEIITTIIQVPENDQNLPCLPKGSICSPGTQSHCCAPYYYLPHPRLRIFWCA
jgi:hypothetical protein